MLLRRLAAFSLALMLLLSGCHREEAAKTTDYSGVSAECPLICIAQSREEAETIARQYGITLVEYDLGVASFFTEEDYRTVIDRGVKNGWVELELNRSATSY